MQEPDGPGMAIASDGGSRFSVWVEQQVKGLDGDDGLGE